MTLSYNLFMLREFEPDHLYKFIFFDAMKETFEQLIISGLRCQKYQIHIQSQVPLFPYKECFLTIHTCNFLRLFFSSRFFLASSLNSSLGSGTTSSIELGVLALSNLALCLAVNNVGSLALGNSPLSSSSPFSRACSHFSSSSTGS